MNYMGYSGLQSLTGHNESGPHLSGAQFADIAGGAYPAVIACLAAILSRNTSGLGQHVDVAMTDCLMPLMSMPLAENLNTNKDLALGDYMLGGGLAHYNIYKCKDEKYVALGSLEPKFWMGFCQMINKREWSNRMIPIPTEVESLKSDLEKVFSEKTQDEWMTLAQQHDICLSPILTLTEASQHAYHLERNNFVSVQLDDTNQIKAVNQPIKFSGTTSSTPILPTPPPQLGEHTEMVLKDFGFSREQILSLKKRGVIQ